MASGFLYFFVLSTKSNTISWTAAMAMIKNIKTLFLILILIQVATMLTIVSTSLTHLAIIAIYKHHGKVPSMTTAVEGEASHCSC